MYRFGSYVIVFTFLVLWAVFFSSTRENITEK